MSEHSKLKWIIDKIGYETNNIRFAWTFKSCYKWWKWDFIELDVREIIFTQDFMDKFRYQLDAELQDNFPFSLLDNLDNPVEYLYNLIK